MIKKILVLICVVLFTACGSQIKNTEKEALVNQLNQIVNAGEISKVESLTNATFKMQDIQLEKVDTQTVLQKILSKFKASLQHEEKEDVLIIESYPLTEVIKQSVTEISVVEGQKYEKKQYTEEEIKNKFLENIQITLDKIENKTYKFPIKFVRVEKEVKFDFKDASTKKIIQAILGE